MTEGKTDVRAIAARLRETRQALKLTQMRLCRLTDISPQAWHNYETAKSKIGTDPAIRFCDATGVTLDWIYRGISSGLPTAIQEALTERRRRGINVNGR